MDRPFQGDTGARRQRRHIHAARARAGPPAAQGGKTWETPGTEGNVAGVDVQRATEPLVGVVDFDGKSIYFAEVGDDGIHLGRLTSSDTLEVVYIEAGYATAFRAALTRRK
jgi:hypothetical protein